MSKSNDLIELTGLWQYTNSKGKTYLSGYLGNAKVMVFKNEFKDNDKHPDYRMFLAPKLQKKPAESSNQATQSFSSQEEDVPF